MDDAEDTRHSRLTPPVPEHVQEQIDALAAMRARFEQSVGPEQRLIETITAKIGRPRTLWLLLGLVLVWVSANLLATIAGHVPADPPPFYWLQGAIGLYAAFASTVVVTTQNRQNKHAEQRAYLELQVNLLAEQKTAKIIHLLEELRRDLPTVRDRVDPEAETLMTSVDPRAVLSALEDTLESTHVEGTPLPSGVKATSEDTAPPRGTPASSRASPV
jgi:uncharacterized membrane protein